MLPPLRAEWSTPYVACCMLPDSTFYTGLAVGARTARAAQSVHRRTSAVVMDAVPFASCSCVTTLSSTG